MDIITQLKLHGTLFNEESLFRILKPLSEREGLEDSYFTESRVFYYTADSRSVRKYSFKNSDDAVFKIVKFGNTRNFFNAPWSFGFVKQKTENGCIWKGAYAGKHGELFNKIKKVIRAKEERPTLLDKVDFPRTISPVDVFSKFNLSNISAELYETLFDKEEWDCLDGVKGLEVYIKNLVYIARDKTLFKVHPSEEFLIIKENSKIQVVFNSRLFNKYLNFILLKVEFNIQNNSFLSEPYYAVGHINIVTDLANFGLEEPLPVIKLCEKSSLVFPSDKITVLDTSAVRHIFEDRENRLSSEVINCSKELLYVNLNYSIELALKQNKVDLQHIAPFLNIKWNKISYLIPLYIRHIDEKNPVCAIVIGETSPGVWSPVTVLKLETARSNARLLGKLHSSWLTEEKGGTHNEDCVSQW